MRKLLALSCLLMVACTPEPSPAPSTPGLPPTESGAPAPAPPGPPAAGPLDEAPAVTTPSADVQAARQVAAQAYLDAARERALRSRHEAKTRCEAGVLDYEACIAAADESFEAALRNARVEFDARMSDQSGG